MCCKFKIRSDQYINHVNNQVQTFPPPDEDELPTVKYGVPLENIWDLAIEKPKSKKKQSISVSDFQMQSRYGVTKRRLLVEMKCEEN